MNFIKAKSEVKYFPKTNRHNGVWSSVWLLTAFVYMFIAAEQKPEKATETTLVLYIPRMSLRKEFMK